MMEDFGKQLGQARADAVLAAENVAKARERVARLEGALEALKLAAKAPGAAAGGAD